MPKEREGDQMSLLMCSCGCGSMPWGARAITLNLDRVAGETRQYPGTEETGLCDSNYREAVEQLVFSKDGQNNLPHPTGSPAV